MADEEARRGYKLGERDPRTLPGSSAGAESWVENRRRTAEWKSIVAWAKKPGGKYHC